MAEKIKCSGCKQYVENENMVWLEYETAQICVNCHNSFLTFMESFRAIDKQQQKASGSKSKMKNKKN
jgi:hypothetical protein